MPLVCNYFSPFLLRRTKTRSFDNLPSACELGSSLAPNRRSSDPSLNEKWQDHRRSLELNVAVGPEGVENQDEVQPYHDRLGSEMDHSKQQSQGSNTERREESSVNPAEDTAEEAELSVAVGVAEGQMVNILQEATKEEAGCDVPREDHADTTQVFNAVDQEVDGHVEQHQMVDVSETVMKRDMFANGQLPENGEMKAQENGDSFSVPTQKEEEQDQQEANASQRTEDLVTENVEESSVQEELAHVPKECSTGEPEEPAAHRTINSDLMYRSPEKQGLDERSCPDSESDHSVPESVELVDKRTSLMESSTETLTEEVCGRVELPVQPPVGLNHHLMSDGRSPVPSSKKEKGLETSEHGLIRTLSEGSKRPSVSAFQSVRADLSRDGLCNGDNSEGEPSGAPYWAKGNVERAPLSRQVSVASCNSLILHPRGSCSQHRWCHALLGRVTMSPEQPTRSHLDDDGLTLHNDAIQQRLRQIEAGHQMEVETLKKQVQELWSRLESQQHIISHRINGDIGDEVVSH